MQSRLNFTSTEVPLFALSIYLGESFKDNYFEFVNAFEYGAEGRIRDSLRVTYPPGYDDTSIVMNYSKLPPFHYTITQQPKDNIPLSKQWEMDDLDINLVADYKP